MVGPPLNLQDLGKADQEIARQRLQDALNAQADKVDAMSHISSDTPSDGLNK